MADPSIEFDLTPNPIRAAASPTLDVVSAGLRTGSDVQPAWIRLTEGFVKVLRWHFADASRIEFPVLVDRVWVADNERSPIVITSLAHWNPTQSAERPAILVDRLDQSKDLQNRGIGDALMGIRPGGYAHFMNGQHVVHCLGGREGEAEYLACEVFREFTRFGRVIAEALCLNKLLTTTVGKRVQLSNEAKEHYSIPVTLFYHYSEAWAVRPTDEEEVMGIKTLFGP